LVKSFIELRRGIPEPLPREIRGRRSLPEISEAIRAMHFPKTADEAKAAERRFIFEDLLLLQLRALRERAQLKQHSAPPIHADVGLIKQFTASLPFSLTDAQRRSIWEIIKDMENPRPMNRLLEGDVGSGKTVAAAAAALLAVKAGYRAAFMAPTEILARQHYVTLLKVLAPFGVSIGLLIGAEKRKKTDADITVGTHALVQKNVRFENLGLVVVDEQHRFGVAQRAVLVTSNQLPVPHGEKILPHFLSMSATPIPRTLALTIYGDLDLSLLDEMPPTRRPVITKIVRPGKRAEAYHFIREEVKKGRQTFVVCPLIETGDKRQTTRFAQQKLLLAEVKTVKEEHKKLSETVFPDLRVAMLHGKMKTREKDAVMEKFRRGETDVLVSTSVIEVGVDVPNAAIMMIEGAERFGLAQLHQFRGRVGRGGEQSYCFLFPTEDGLTTRRLRAVAETENGFELAEQDLKIRGPGELFGLRQSGASDLILKGITDPNLVREVRQEALYLAKSSPDLSRYPALAARLRELETTVHLE
jgi:ATP-dependent DNA helicase RecG